MNVGGPYGEGCSPPVKRMGVGAAIVLGARESRVHGEGRQGIDVRPTNSRISPGEVWVSDERKADDRGGGKSPIPGEPGAVKVARPVRRGVWGNTVRLCALRLPYLVNARQLVSHAMGAGFTRAMAHVLSSSRVNTSGLVR
jgi:hypothetical protein